ncbi:uncharacterized protein TA08435 [Theileria annulata]|uniref:PCI domain-containing protein n=1 Tax=Theileria annulata TaxID=5874 RepID=Q4U9M7_THEAN|nr:uncharacterized protein TA08435 [Theileria annulata]CAI76476.1 hypothetical protein, conserved [Theileria annulata]|eukprot:XP_953101.1 hypothetical protein, conserved [Theileria annulata]
MVAVDNVGTQFPNDAFKDLVSQCISLLEAAVAKSESRFVIRLMRHYKSLRSLLKAHPATSVPFLRSLLKEYAFGANPCPVAEKAYNFLPADLLPPIFSEPESSTKSADVSDTTKPQFDLPKFHYTTSTYLEIQEYVSQDSQLTETKVMLSTLALIYLIDTRNYEKAMDLADSLAHLMLSLNKRIMDYLGAKVYFYYSRSFELGGRFKDARKLTFDCFAQKSMPASRPNDTGSYFQLHTEEPDSPQAVLLSIQIRKVLSVQLEYSEAYTKLIQSLRKAPQNDKTAYGFKLLATKMSVIVGLLMCDIPSKSVFTNPSMRKDLAPYEAVVVAVRNGDLNSFLQLCDKYAHCFEKDDTMFLISRLRDNVIKGGLRKINLAYSKINLANVAHKLGLESVEHTENIIAKAIHDGIIEAVIDHENQCVNSKVNVDLYKSYEPMRAFHKRIQFCLKLHSNAIQAMRYPEDPESTKENKTTSNPDKDQLESVRK